MLEQLSYFCGGGFDDFSFDRITCCMCCEGYIESFWVMRLVGLQLRNWHLLVDVGCSSYNLGPCLFGGEHCFKFIDFTFNCSKVSGSIQFAGFCCWFWHHLRGVGDGVLLHAFHYLVDKVCNFKFGGFRESGSFVEGCIEAFPCFEHPLLTHWIWRAA